jgi:hypothetical protein
MGEEMGECRAKKWKAREEEDRSSQVRQKTVQVFSEDFLQTPSVPQSAVKGWSKTCNGFGGNVRKMEEREKGKKMEDLGV